MLIDTFPRYAWIRVVVKIKEVGWKLIAEDRPEYEDAKTRLNLFKNLTTYGAGKRVSHDGNIGIVGFSLTQAAILPDRQQSGT